MLGRITRVDGNNIYIKLDIDIYSQENLINKYIVFEENIKLIGEIKSIENDTLLVSLIGQIINNSFVNGVVNTPSFKSNVRLINEEELKILYNISFVNSINIGKSYYNKFDINLDVNNLFSNHFAILGNSGSGKSYSTSRILQNIFYEAQNKIPFRTNIFLFDGKLVDILHKHQIKTN